METWKVNIRQPSPDEQEIADKSGFFLIATVYHKDPEIRMQRARLIAAAPDFKWLAERAMAIRNAQGWSKSELAASWADWDAHYTAAIAKTAGQTA